MLFFIRDKNLMSNTFYGYFIDKLLIERIVSKLRYALLKLRW